MKHRRLRLVLTLMTIIAAQPLLAENRSANACGDTCEAGWTCCAYGNNGPNDYCCGYSYSACCGVGPDGWCRVFFLC